jgi:hypothetical protein
MYSSMRRERISFISVLSMPAMIFRMSLFSAGIRIVAVFMAILVQASSVTSEQALCVKDHV